MKEFPKEVMEKTIKNIRKKYKEIKSVETIKNQLLGVQVKNQSASVKSYAIQFTGEDRNIAKIERIAKPQFKVFKIHRTKDCHGCLNYFFSLRALNKSFDSCSYIIYIGDWVVFEQSDDERPKVKVVYDRTFKQFYEESTSIF
jgi:hypothetical protein